VADYAGRRVALGMNVLELSQNKEVTEFVAKDLAPTLALAVPNQPYNPNPNPHQVTEFVAKDLNEDPTLPFEVTLTLTLTLCRPSPSRTTPSTP